MLFAIKPAIFICLLLGLALNQVSAHCSGDCPETEDVVWALGGGCSVFRNKCYFDQENCHRKPALTIATKEECQKQCADICPAIYQPVSGTYKGELRNFGNECEKRAHTCRTGETFL
nr:uncharacterized protein LOC108020830 [Drosophila suzukii]